VAAVWVPDSWYDVGARLLWTDVILFVGATVGAFLCHIGIIGDKTPSPIGDIMVTIPKTDKTTKEIANALRKELSKD
jgi:ssRNA-specific RNase YbeY (16S rRNA maturation enzyme)